MPSESKIKTFTDLRVWREAHELAVLIYDATKEFPASEVFGLTNQMRRAAVSITSNIAEGFSREHYGEKVRFYHIALGSLTELQNQLLLARDLHFASAERFKQLAQRAIEAHKLLNAFIRKSKDIRDS